MNHLYVRTKDLFLYYQCLKLCRHSEMLRVGLNSWGPGQRHRRPPSKSAHCQSLHKVNHGSNVLHLMNQMRIQMHVWLQPTSSPKNAYVPTEMRNKRTNKAMEKRISSPLLYGVTSSCGRNDRRPSLGCHQLWGAGLMRIRKFASHPSISHRSRVT